MATQTVIRNAGPVGPKPKGPYSDGNTYSLLDTVLYDHDSWICVAMNPDGSAATVTGEAPSDSSRYWLALTDGGRAAMAVAGQVRTEFDEWFGATAAEGIRKVVNDWFTAEQASWAGWSAEQKQAWTAWFDARRTEWSTLSAEVSAATTRANTAAAHSEDLNAHPAYVADGSQTYPGDPGYLYTWSHAAQQYVRGAKLSLDWESMSQEEKDALAQAMLDHLVFAQDQTCADAAAEIVFVPQENGGE